MKPLINAKPQYGFVAIKYFLIIGLTGLIILFGSIIFYTLGFLSSLNNIVFLFAGLSVAYVCLHSSLSYIPLYFQLLRPPKNHDLWMCIIKSLNVSGNVSILDVGCGTGKVSISLARQFPLAHVTGIDLFHGVSGTSPVQPTLNAKLEGVSDRVSFLPGNMLNIPFPDNSFNIVTAGSVLH